MTRLAGARLEGIAYREALPDDWNGKGPCALLVHGWPESSYMWRYLLPVVAEQGYRAVAPDLPGYGDSQPDPPGTWERHVEALERFRRAAGLTRPVLVLHDWGVLIGLRWACDHPGEASALVISDGGFFSDRRWHDLANRLRTPGQGEAIIEALDREAIAAGLRDTCPTMSDDAVDEYWKAFADPVRRRGVLELYRSGDFDKLVPYEGRLASLGLPVLIVWGANDPFATVQLAHRFQKELPGSELVVLDDAGHFIWEEQPALVNAAVGEFLARLGP